jgi:hypothetical protein
VPDETVTGHELRDDRPTSSHGGGTTTSPAIHDDAGDRDGEEAEE